MNRENMEKKKSANNIGKSVDGYEKKYAFTFCNSDTEDNVNESWLFNSDATIHMTNNVKWFTNRFSGR